LKTERVAMAYRLLFAYAFVRPESEQDSSHLQIEDLTIQIDALKAAAPPSCSSG
jgi:hypothetical protein